MDKTFIVRPPFPSCPLYFLLQRCKCLSSRVIRICPQICHREFRVRGKFRWLCPCWCASKASITFFSSRGTGAVPQDRFCKCKCCLGGETHFWCFLLHPLPRILWPCLFRLILKSSAELERAELPGVGVAD